jgi:hypothetical protein
MQKSNLLKRSLLLFLLSIIMVNTQAQTGLNFQGVARTSNNVILASQAITIKLSILQGSSTGTADYTETRRVTTNAQGLFTAVIGDTGAISTLGNFTTINWKLTPKFLKIEMDAAAGTNFITMGTTQFQYVAYAQFAKSVDAENIVGIVPVTLGGTGVNSLTGLKTALALNNVNNTTDLTKPISTLTQTALDLKLNAADTSKYTRQTYLDSSLVAKQVLISLKLNAADSSKFTKQTYSDSALLTKLKISDTTAMLSSRIARDTLNLSNRINLKANTTDVTTSLSLKENISNKSTAVDLGGTSPSDVLFPTQKAVKEYIAANNAGGGVADGGITNSKLAEAAVTNDKIASGIDKSKVGLGNVDNTADSLKPISIPVQAALDSKASSSELRSFVKIDTVNRFISEQLFDAGLTTASLTLGGGTRIESGINSETTLFNRSGADFIINTTAISGNDTPTSSSWIFKSDGTLSFDNLVSFKFDSIVEEFKLSSDKDIVIESYNDSLRLYADKEISILGNQSVGIRSFNNVFIGTGLIQDGDQILPKNLWRFDEEGNLEFPNMTKIEAGTATETIIRNAEQIDFSIITNDGEEDHKITFSKNGTLRFYGSNETTERFTFDMESGSLKFYDGSRFYYTIDDMFSIKGNNGLSLRGGFENTKEAEILLTTSTNDEIENEGETQGDIYLKTKFYPDESDSDEIVNTWKFGNDGILTFPDGSTLAGNYSGSTYFELNTYESNGVKITTNSGLNPITWSFNSTGSTGIMIFPDNTQIGPNFLGSNNFGIGIENKAFEIVTANFGIGIENHWIFDKSGVLTLPTLENAPSPGTLQVGAFAVAKPTSWDPLNKSGTEAYPVFYNGNNWVEFGTGVGSGNSTPTSIVYVDPDLPTNFNIFTADEFGAMLQFYQDGVIEKEWSYNTDGSLTFPDGTIISGSISGTANFGFDTRATDNGFTLITAGTLSGTSQLWSYNTDGSLTFPDGTITSGNISSTSNFGFDTRANESGFTIITGTSSSTTQWTFDTDGSLKRNNISVLNFQMEEFKVTSQGSDITNPQSPVDIRVDSDNDYIWKFELEHTPISIRKTAFYINGKRLSQTQYSLSNNVITFDIRIWDNPPFGNYQFYIDYQY